MVEEPCPSFFTFFGNTLTPPEAGAEDDDDEVPHLYLSSKHLRLKISENAWSPTLKLAWNSRRDCTIT